MHSKCKQKQKNYIAVQRFIYTGMTCNTRNYLEKR